MSYNYREVVKEDIKDFLISNFGVDTNYYYDLECEDFEDFKEKVMEELDSNDGVTGCQFGYEGFDRDEYIEAVLENWNLLNDAIDELGYYFEESDFSYWYEKFFVEKDWSRLDAYIREYIVSMEGESIIEQLYSNGEIKIHEEDYLFNPEVELSDEDYDEGFEESLSKRRHRRRY